MSSTTTPAYFVVLIKAKSLDELIQRYGNFAIPLLEKFEGQMIAGTPVPEVIEGTWDGNWAAVLRFTSLELAHAWYNSAEYQPLRDLRINELTEDGRILLLEGMAPTTVTG